jgi:hypothetical protein
MKRRFTLQLRNSPGLFCVAVAMLSILSLLGTSGCSMAGVYPGMPTPTNNPKEEQTPSEATTTKEVTKEVTLVVTQHATAVTKEASKEVAAAATKVVSPSPTTSPSSTPTVTSTTTDATPTPASTSTDTPTPAPTIEAATVSARAKDVNPLTGLKVPDSTVLQRLPLFVRIGNDPQIRPQSGLASADLVYEEIMDGWWITRLTAVFLSEDLEAVGPIRSARLVNLQMVPQYKGGLVHSGASDPIRWRLSESDIVDLDEFFHRSPYFYREGADWRGRLFVNMKALREYLEEQGLEKDTALEGFTFDADGNVSPDGRPATDLTIPYPKNSVVRFNYDPTSGLYQRFVQGQAHLDALTNKQLSAANVIILFCPHEKTDIVEDSQGTTSINIVVAGEGKVLIFRDGMVREGRWLASDPNRMPRFVDNDGQPIALKPGQTWVELVPLDYEITTSPAGLLGGGITATSAVTSSVPAAEDTPVATATDGETDYPEEISVAETPGDTVAPPEN